MAGRLALAGLLLLARPSGGVANEALDEPDFPTRTIKIMAPANPGGGWDQLARLMQHTLRNQRIVEVPVEVINRGGAGGTIASFLAYIVEKRVSRRESEFGRGAIEGVAGPEAANNAAAGGSLVPLLALGIPGSATTAVMLAAFQMYGIQPGPLLFTSNASLVWGLIASLYIANVLLVALNLPLVGMWARLLKAPQELLYSAVLVFSTLGAYSLKGSVGDVITVWVLGVLAFCLRKYQVPIAPVLLGLVLSPLLEQEFRRSMTLSGGDLSIFVRNSISLGFLMLALFSICGSIWAARSARKAGAAGGMVS